jgi:hypothetical protein
VSPDPVAREMRTMLARLESMNGTMGRDDRVLVMRRLLDAEPDSAVMIRLSAHAYVYARELRALEERATRLASGQMELGA